MENSPSSLKLRFAAISRRLREQLPVKRKRYNKFVASVEAELARLSSELRRVTTKLADTDVRIDAVADTLLALPGLATSARVTALEPIHAPRSAEVCLFVTFASTPTLKRHVVDHVLALKSQGIDVVLIVNTPHSAERFVLETEFAKSLDGLLIRENCGFDFGAWAHGYSLLPNPRAYRRLYLINDSIVGPIDFKAHEDLLERVRQSPADVVGLTENSMPQAHLQSYFLVINQRLLHADAFARLMLGIVNLPTKQGVIEQYETQVTRFLRAHGFRCEALFPQLSRDPHDKLLSNDTINHWTRLIELGFPFVKAEVLSSLPTTEDVTRWIPKRFLKFVESSDNGATTERQRHG